MSCTSPNKVFYVGVNPETGKKKILFTSRFVDYVYKKPGESSWQLASRSDPVLARRAGYLVVTEHDKVPCGQCMSCRLDYSRQWATRVMLEAKNYDKNELWFVTLTYDDEHLPLPRMVAHPVTGEMIPSEFRSVSKEHHTKFMKDLRKHYGIGIRFFMSAEYGDTSYRPHYHYALFGLKLDDLEFYKMNWRGEKYYKSATLQDKIWKRGQVVVGNLDYDSAAYVSRYITKKLKGMEADYYDKIGVDPEFCLMSRKPGIGKDYFDDNYEAIYETEEITLSTYDGSFTTKVPRYFDSLYEKIDPAAVGQIKRERKKTAEEADRFRQVQHEFIDEEDLFSSRDRRVKSKVILKKGSDL